MNSNKIVQNPRTPEPRNPSIQDRIAEMMNPGLYGKGVRQVRMLQTHTSWVFLTGRRAYKVKKPVNFGFLDYTTLGARRRFCREEFRLNRLLSPDLYLKVLPIAEAQGRPVLGGKGRVIDYCLVMRELPQERIMTEQLRQGQVTYDHIDQVARSIAEFHARADRGPDVAQYGNAKTIRFNWVENFQQTEEFQGKTISPKAFAEIQAAIQRFLADNQALFRRRRAGGFVRRCHGDLHSRNIFVLGGASGEHACTRSDPNPRPAEPPSPSSIRIFDCIEFNPRFSCSDVASEIAFMAMDLDYAGRKDLADFLVERYLVYTDDAGLPRLLNFYKCYRAYVRGKVTSFALKDPGISAADKKQARTTARKYFALAQRYAQTLSASPRLVVMMGLPGVGKTFLARQLAERIHAFHFLSDSVRKQLLGLPGDSCRASDFGQGIYQADISQRTYAELLRRAGVFLRAGLPVVVDATFLEEQWRNQARRTAARARAPTLFVQADCPEPVVAARLQRRAREQTFSDASLEVYRTMKRRFFKPQAASLKLPSPEDGLGPAACGCVRVDTSRPLERILARIERALLRL